jgi:rubrerythrin
MPATTRAVRPATPETGVHLEQVLLCLQVARHHARLAACPATLRKIRTALKSAEGAKRRFARRLGAANGKPDHSEDRVFRNFYRCDRCGHEWEDVWSAACDDDCPACGARHMSPYQSEGLEAAP